MVIKLSEKTSFTPYLYHEVRGNVLKNVSQKIVNLYPETLGQNTYEFYEILLTC
jgi:hypothetical protein